MGKTTIPSVRAGAFNTRAITVKLLEASEATDALAMPKIVRIRKTYCKAMSDLL